MVVEQTQLLIPSFWMGAHHDPRLTIECRDAWQVLRERREQGERFDIIVFDLTDQGDEGIATSDSTANHLYSGPAFELAAQLLQLDGIFVAQVQELSLIRRKLHSELRRRIQTPFRRVWSYRVFVEYFGYWESFVMATNNAGLEMPFPAESGEELLATLYSGNTPDVWSDAWHRSLFALPPVIARELDIRR
jgi:spermidine synthase